MYSSGLRLRFWSKIPTPFVSIFFISSVFAISLSLFVFLQFHQHVMFKYLIKSTAYDLGEVEEGGGSISLGDDVILPPPSNETTAIGSMMWFKHKLPEFKILESTTRTRLFDHRVQEFLGGQVCMVRFFMTWVSPANRFGGRELLSLESVFKAHPRGCVVILSRTLDSNPGRRVLQPLLDKGFHVVPIAPDLPLLFNNTPAQTWLEDLKAGKVDPGRIPLGQNLSNLLRLVVVYKYGGVYLDTDFIILKDVSSLRNSIGAQSIDEKTKGWTRLNNAILIFDKGHHLLLKFMEEFASHFNGNRWGYNGPYLVSRVVERVAHDSRFEFTILSPMAFYPVDWIKISRLFQRPNNMTHANWSNTKLLHISEETYGVHLWNKQSHRLRIEEGSVIGKLISKHCIVCHDIYGS